MDQSNLYLYRDSKTIGLKPDIYISKRREYVKIVHANQTIILPHSELKDYLEVCKTKGYIITSSDERKLAKKRRYYEKHGGEVDQDGKVIKYANIEPKILTSATGILEAIETTIVYFYKLHLHDLTKKVFGDEYFITSNVAGYTKLRKDKGCYYDITTKQRVDASNINQTIERYVMDGYVGLVADDYTFCYDRDELKIRIARIQN